LANAFVARGVHVDFVLANCQGPYVAELSSTVRVVDLATTRWLTALWKLARYLKRERPDALLSGLDVANAIAVLASLSAGALSRCVISQRAVVRAAWQIERPRTWRMWVGLFRQTYPRPRLVICNSSAAAAECVLDLGVDPAKCVVVLNAVDVPRITSLATETVDDNWLNPMAPPLLLSVGSLTPRKDMGTLLHALAIVRRSRRCNLLILGEGSERAELEALTRQLGLEECVRLPGFVANPFPWMARASVLLSASLAEGCPNVIQQALALGTAIVATDCPGGTGEVLEGGKWGRLVPMRDPLAMAEAILATMVEPTHSDGRARARCFDSGRIAERYLHLLLSDSPVTSTHRDYPLETNPA
jgi:glycosyltransferase involved in cell wall biosynthesis